MSAVRTDFGLALGSQANITIAIQPPTSISGWTIQVDQLKNFGGSPLISKFLASGFFSGFVSGINLIDGLNGVFQVQFLPADLSGQLEGNYPFSARRTDIPEPLAYGYRIAQQQ